MEFLFPFQFQVTSSCVAVAACIFTFLSFFYYYYYYHLYILSYPNNASNHKMVPRARGAWPLIGHLHLLGGPQLPHVTLGNMADEYGPIFAIQLGTHQAIIVSSSEMAQECFTTANDRAFSARPKVVAIEHMGYNYAMFAFAPCDTYWREMRKIAVHQLLSNHALAKFEGVRTSEVKASITEIFELWVKNKDGSDRVLVEMKGWFGDLMLNLVLRILVGKQRKVNGQRKSSRDGDKWLKVIFDFFELMGAFTVSDALNFLRPFDIGGYEKLMKKTGREFDQLLQECLEDHKLVKDSGIEKDDQDFMDLLLSLLDAKETSNFDADTINKATCLTVITGSVDTTTVTLTWALSLLLNNGHALKKAQDELDVHVGKDRHVKESDLKNLVYLQAIIKETLRLYPATQLSPPRESTEDCNIGGYLVPKGTRLFLNLSKIHRDPHFWPDPLKFQPERFLTTHKDVDVRGQHFELLPFGSGRRGCPGIYFANQVIELTLASFLHAFEITTLSSEPVDMTESFGFTNIKATALEVLLRPRLSSPDLYV